MECREPHVAICLFAKPPIAGQCKSRLARSIGERPAAELAAAMLRDLLETLSVATTSWKFNATLFICYPPDATVESFHQRHDYPADVQWFQQQGTTLGARLEHCFQHMLSRHQHCIAIGSDCPGIDRATIESAVLLLEQHQVVLQGADDGGYTLLATGAFYPELFNESIPWGEQSVFQATIDAACLSNRSVGLLPESFDIDEFEDLKRLVSHIQQHNLRHTERWCHNNLPWPVGP